MNREELLETVRNSTPQLGWDSLYPMSFGKYGYTFSNVFGDGWRWKDNLDEATDIELLFMWGKIGNYWYKKYQNWYDLDQDKLNILSKFVGKWERNYFGYGKNGYTTQEIERIFTNVDKMLEQSYGKHNQYKQTIF